MSTRMAALGVTGVSVAAIRGRALVDVEASGRTRSGGRPVTTETLFQAASLSKPVTALAVLRLADAGRIDLDVDVDAYLGGWRLPRSASVRGTPVTPRRLLSHTAGVTVHGFPGYVIGSELPTLAKILDGVPPANTPPVLVDIEPGSAWRYSGGGYAVLQRVIEEVTSRSFADAMGELVLGPLAMNGSSFAQPLPPNDLASAAQPHDSAGGPLIEGAHLYPELAAAGLWTTAVDLGRFAVGLQAALAGAKGAVLSQDLARAMVTPGLGRWGLGLIGGGTPGSPEFGHNGSNAGFRSWLWARADGIGLVVLTNGDGGQPIAEELFRAIDRP